jgi:hypothetical protein
MGPGHFTDVRGHRSYPPTSSSDQCLPSLGGLARLTTPPPRLEATMAATGTARTRSRPAPPRQEDEAALVHKLVSRVGRRSHRVWDDGWLHCRYDASAADLAALFLVQCLHCATIGTAGGHTFHIMWHCPSSANLCGNSCSRPGAVSARGGRTRPQPRPTSGGPFSAFDCHICRSAPPPSSRLAQNQRHPP